MKNYKGTREFLLDNIEYISGKTLDLGAGNAKYRNIISEKAEPYLALDKFKTERVDIVADIHDTKLLDNEFDTVICTQVLEHVEDPFLVIKEIFRILKPGGRCILTAPFIYPYHADPEDYFRFSLPGLEKIFFRERFKIIRSGKYGGWSAVMASFVKEKYLRTKNTNNTLYFIFERIFKVLTKFDSTFLKTNNIYSNAYIIAQK